MLMDRDRVSVHKGGVKLQRVIWFILPTQGASHIRKQIYLKYVFTNVTYYMALSHKDWELPISRIWLAEMDIDRGLDFPI